MKKLMAIALGLALLTSAALAGDEKPWFDMPNCDICKNMLTTEGMLNEIQWQQLEIAQGGMTVTVVPEKFAENWSQAEAAMHAVGEKVARGESANLCGYCTSLGALMASGKMQMENHQTIGGEVTLFTSTDPATVAAIHKHFERSIADYDKMMSEMSAGGR